MAQPLTPLGQALAGALGAVFSNATVYPLDTVKTRIQAAPSEVINKDKTPSILSELLQIYNEEGVLGFYGGFTANILNTFQTQYIYFFFYSYIRRSWIKRVSRNSPTNLSPPVLSTVAELAIGALAGALAQIFTIPVSVIATRQQIAHHQRNKKGKQPMSPKFFGGSESADSASRDLGKIRKNTFFEVAQQIIREDGVTGLWLGLKPSLVLTINPAITYGLFERIKSAMLLAKMKTGSSLKLAPWESFLVGALSKTLATVITYPYIMAKVKIQAGSEDTELDLPAFASNHKRGHKHIGALALLRKSLREKGVSSWYQGMSAQIIKAVLSQALLFMSKDQFEHYALGIISLYARALRRI